MGKSIKIFYDLAQVRELTRRILTQTQQETQRGRERGRGRGRGDEEKEVEERERKRKRKRKRERNGLPGIILALWPPAPRPHVSLWHSLPYSFTSPILRATSTLYSLPLCCGAFITSKRVVSARPTQLGPSYIRVADCTSRAPDVKQYVHTYIRDTEETHAQQQTMPFLAYRNSLSEHRRLRQDCAQQRPPPELKLPRRGLARLLASRSGHGDFVVYHRRFDHPNAERRRHCGALTSLSPILPSQAQLSPKSVTR